MKKYVRPSSFQLAEECARAPYLGLKYPEANAATEFGSAVDGQASRALSHPERTLVLNPGEKAMPEALAIIEWASATFPADAWEFWVQRKVKLMDPMTGELLTEGTPDLLALNRSKRFLCVVDWKKIGQWWAGHLAAPDDNLQQLIYLVSAALELSYELGCEIDSGQITLACFDDRGVSPQVSREIPQSEWWEVIDRVKAVPMVDLDGPEPIATRGEHCTSCYNRHHCSAYLLPEKSGMDEALAPMTHPGELTAEQAAQAVMWVQLAKMRLKQGKELLEIVEGNLEAFVTRRGPITVCDRQWGAKPTMSNRRPPSLKELEALGRADLIKPGEPGVKFDWLSPAKATTKSKKPAATRTEDKEAQG